MLVLPDILMSDSFMSEDEGGSSWSTKVVSLLSCITTTHEIRCLTGAPVFGTEFPCALAKVLKPEKLVQEESCVETPAPLLALLVQSSK